MFHALRKIVATSHSPANRHASRARTRCALAARCAVEAMEARTMFAGGGGGGGLTASGLAGEYFPNDALSGAAPAFTRQDVRVDFEWGTRAPGGSSAVPYRNVPADNFSVRWKGQVIPEFSEPYTFHATADDGVRMWYKPAGAPDTAYVSLIDQWFATPQTAREHNSTPVSLTAGQKYDVKIEYHELSGGATMKLEWSSASTPRQVIDPVRGLSLGLTGHNDSNVDKSYVDLWRTRRNYDPPLTQTEYPTGRPNDAPGEDANNWAMGDFRLVLWDGS